MTDNELLAAAQTEFDAALADHDAAEVALVEIKERVTAETHEANEAVLSALPSEFEDAVFAAEKALEPFVDELHEAYERFGRLALAEHNLKRAQHGLRPVGQPKSAPEGVTQLTAHAVVSSDVIAQ